MTSRTGSSVIIPVPRQAYCRKQNQMKGCLTLTLITGLYLVISIFLGCKPTITVPTQTHVSTSGGTSTSTSSSATAATPVETIPFAAYSPDDCPTDTLTFRQPNQLGLLTDAYLKELSGMAPSNRNPGCFWGEEDSGNPNEIQLIRFDGQVIAHITLKNIPNRDWEDIFVGPGPQQGQSYIYVADIGDNKLRYPTKELYRFPEPLISDQTLPRTLEVTNIETLSFTLADGPKNMEAFLVDPQTLDIVLLSKGDQSTVYLAPWPQATNKPTVLQPVLKLRFDKVTSAACSPTGNEVLIRTYGQVFHYTRRGNESVISLLGRTPRRYPLANEPQGEAVGWSLDSNQYFTTTEGVGNDLQPISAYRRR